MGYPWQLESQEFCANQRQCVDMQGACLLVNVRLQVQGIYRTRLGRKLAYGLTTFGCTEARPIIFSLATAMLLTCPATPCAKTFTATLVPFHRPVQPTTAAQPGPPFVLRPLGEDLMLKYGTYTYAPH